MTLSSSSPSEKMKVAVLISGSGSNLQALIDSQKNSNYEIVLVVSNRPGVFGLTRAEQANIKNVTLDHTQFDSREAFDQALVKVIDQESIDFVILAGFMRILTPEFTLHYLGRMLNIHPSLLPKYPGLHTHRKALEAGDTTHGVSIHFVTPELDGGPVILQAEIDITKSDTELTLKDKIHLKEHKIYPIATQWLASGQVKLTDNIAYYQNEPLLTPLKFTE